MTLNKSSMRVIVTDNIKGDSKSYDDIHYVASNERMVILYRNNQVIAYINIDVISTVDIVR
jgi:uncharacterized protein YlbG (UPF0298 family)